MTEAVDSFIKSLLGDDVSITDRDFTTIAEDKLTQKLIENKLIKIHGSVLSNPKN